MRDSSYIDGRVTTGKRATGRKPFPFQDHLMNRKHKTLTMKYRREPGAGGRIGVGGREL